SMGHVVLALLWSLVAVVKAKICYGANADETIGPHHTFHLAAREERDYAFPCLLGRLLDALARLLDAIARLFHLLDRLLVGLFGEIHDSLWRGIRRRRRRGGRSCSGLGGRGGRFAQGR